MVILYKKWKKYNEIQLTKQFFTLKLQTKQGLFYLMKEVSTIQYYYRKCGTHALVSPKHLCMGSLRLK